MPFRLVKNILSILLAGLLLNACASAPTQLPPSPAGTNVPSVPAAAASTGIPATSTPEPAPSDGPLAPAAKDRFAGVDPKGQKIVYWNSQTGKNQAALEKIVQEFNTSNQENITVEAVGLGSEDAVFTRVQQVFKTKDQPDLVDASQDHAAVYQLAGALEDINGLMTSAKWGLTTREFNDLPSGVMAQDIHTVFLGARLGFPVSRSMGLLYANLDWLKELGVDQPAQSPEQLKTAACKAARQPYTKRVSQTAAPLGLVIPADSTFFVQLIYAFGGDIFGTANNFYTLGANPAVKAAAFVQDLVKEGCARFSPDSASAWKMLREGEALFTPASSDDLAQAAADFKFKWTVAPLPYSTPDPVLTVTGTSLSIPKGSPEKELAAWLFVNYLASPAVQAEWASASGYLPLRGAAGPALGEYFAQNPAFQKAFELLKYAKSEPPVPGSSQVQKEIRKALTILASPPYPEAGAVLTQLNQTANQALQNILSKQK